MSRTEYEEQMFQRYCRQPGTRINDIMVLIESGFTDKDIAAIIGKKKADGYLDTQPYDIAVYRKALHGDLCRLATWDDPGIREPLTNAGMSKEERDRIILEMYSEGYNAKELAKMFGIRKDRVYVIARAGGWTGRRSKQGVKLR